MTRRAPRTCPGCGEGLQVRAVRVHDVDAVYAVLVLLGEGDPLAVARVAASVSFSLRRGNFIKGPSTSVAHERVRLSCAE